MTTQHSDFSIYEQLETLYGISTDGTKTQGASRLFSKYVLIPYFKLKYNGETMDTNLNNKDIIHDVHELMYAKNYTNYNEKSMGKDDIHNSFTDFIVTSNLFLTLLTTKNSNEDNHVKEFIKNVYVNWDSLKKDVQDIYQYFFNLRDMDSLTKYTNNIKTTETDKTNKKTAYETVKKEYDDARTMADKDALKPDLDKASDALKEVTKKLEDLNKNLPTVAFIDDYKTIDIAKPYKILFKKDSKDKTIQDVIKFFLDQDHLHVWYTDTSNNVVFINTQGDKFWTVYTTLPIAKEFNDNMLHEYLHYLWIGKLLRYRLLEIAYGKYNMSTNKTSNEHDEYYDFISDSIWKRDNKGKLYTMKDNKKIEINSKEYNEMIDNLGTCSSTYVSSSDCNNYIEKCLLSDGSFDECLKIINKNGFTETMQKEIKNMNPSVALRILQKFQFIIIKEFDPFTKISIKKIESAESWVKRMLSQLPDTDAAKKPGSNDITKTIMETIENSRHILTYFQSVVDFINNNPAILNTGFTGTPGVSNYKCSMLAEKYKIPLRTEPNKLNLSTDMERFRKQLDHNYGSIVSTSEVVNYDPSISVKMIGGKMTLPNFNLQQGGKIKLIDNYVGNGNLENEYIFGAKILYGIFITLCNKLKSMNKDIREEDKKKIIQKIKLMAENEIKIIYDLKCIEEYANALEDVHICDRKTETVNMQSLQNLISGYSNLRKKHIKDECVMTDIMIPLVKLIEKEKDNDKSLHEEIDKSSETIGNAIKKLYAKK